MQPDWNKPMPSVQPNVIEYEEGKEPTNYQHKVHMSPSGPILTPPELHIPPPRVQTAQPPRVDKGGPSYNLRSRGKKNPLPLYALIAQWQKPTMPIQLPINLWSVPVIQASDKRHREENLGKIICKRIGTISSRYPRGKGDKYSHVHFKISSP